MMIRPAVNSIKPLNFSTPKYLARICPGCDTQFRARALK